MRFLVSWYNDDAQNGILERGLMAEEDSENTENGHQGSCDCAAAERLTCKAGSCIGQIHTSATECFIECVYKLCVSQNVGKIDC